MWYRNMKTGKIWDVTDEKVLKRIQRSPNYEPAPEEELPFVPEDEPVIKPKPAPKKAGGRSGRTTVKTKK